MTNMDTHIYTFMYIYKNIIKEKEGMNSRMQKVGDIEGFQLETIWKH